MWDKARMYGVHRWASGLLALALCSALACGDEPAEVAEAVRPVKTFEVGSSDGAFNREWPGRIEPTQNAELSFAVPGDIIELPVIEGQEIQQGDVVAKIDARQYRARLDREKAQLAFDKTEYERSSKLVSSGAVARAELDRKSRALAVSKAAVAEARKALDDAKLVAPFTGTVAKTMVSNFESVQAKQIVAIIQDASSLEVVTHVSQRDYAAAEPGLSVEERNAKAEGRVHVVLDTQPDLEIPAQIKEIASVPDPITGTYEVTWSFEPPEGITITPGMTAKVVLAGITEDPGAAAGVFVPIEAVVGSDEGGAHVWVIDTESMAVSQVAVETGGLSGDSIEVSSGLEGGELIATTGVHALREGEVVSRFEDLYGNTERAQ